MALTNDDLQAIGALFTNAITSAKDEILESVHTSKMDLYKEIVICEKNIIIIPYKSVKPIELLRVCTLFNWFEVYQRDKS